MDPAALNGGAENLGGGRFQPLVVVGDDQAGAAQTATGKGAEKVVPEHLGLAGLDGDTQDLSAPVKIDRHGHYGGDTDDAPGPAHLDVGGVQPEIGPFAFQRTVQEGADAPSISPQSRDTWLFDTPVMPMALTRSSTTALKALGHKPLE